MTVRELVETLRNHGFIIEGPLEPNAKVEEALALLEGAYEVRAEARVFQNVEQVEDTLSLACDAHEFEEYPALGYEKMAKALCGV